MTRRAAQPGQDPATLRLRPPTWTRAAHCAADDQPLPPTAWDDGTPAARAVCATCPVQLACARYALDNAIPTGMWGGLDEDDRHALATRHGYDRPGSPRHGTYPRYTAGCRCPGCVEAKRRYIADRTALIGQAAHGRAAS